MASIISELLRPASEPKVEAWLVPVSDALSSDFEYR